MVVFVVPHPRPACHEWKLPDNIPPSISARQFALKLRCKDYHLDGEASGLGDVFPEPQALFTPTAKVPGIDGRKMSKSYGNTIEIFGDEKALRKKIMGIVMDSRTSAEPKPDADKNLAVQLLRLFAPKDVAADYENRLRAGGLGYGDLKKALFEHYWNFFASYRAKRAELAANSDYVEKVLRDGAVRARVVAEKTMARARQACGLR